MEEFFADGKITIDRRTCHGVECKLCIDACPTNALFWKAGEVGLTEELCIYCLACVLCCIVDDCIKVERVRGTGEVECFSKPDDVLKQQRQINVNKRLKRVKDVFPRT